MQMRAVEVVRAPCRPPITGAPCGDGEAIGRDRGAERIGAGGHPLAAGAVAGHGQERRRGDLEAHAGRSGTGRSSAGSSRACRLPAGRSGKVVGKEAVEAGQARGCQPRRAETVGRHDAGRRARGAGRRRVRAAGAAPGRAASRSWRSSSRSETLKTPVRRGRAARRTAAARSAPWTSVAMRGGMGSPRR